MSTVFFTGGCPTTRSGDVVLSTRRCAAVPYSPTVRDDEPDERAQEQPVTGVVRELQVDVRIVDGRVAAERIVRDVEGVIRSRDDRQPGLVGRVEDGGRDLADAAAEPGLQLAVDDHRRLEEALLGAALTRRAVERERLAGRDQLAVDQMRDQLDVVDAIRLAAVEGLVGRHRAGDPHRLRLRGRTAGLPFREHELGNPVGRPLGRGEHASGRPRDVDPDPGHCGHDANMPER